MLLRGSSSVEVVSGTNLVQAVSNTPPEILIQECTLQFEPIPTTASLTEVRLAIYNALNVLLTRGLKMRINIEGDLDHAIGAVFTGGSKLLY